MQEVYEFSLWIEVYNKKTEGIGVERLAARASVQATLDTLISAVVTSYSLCLAIALAFICPYSDKPSNLHPNGV